jgi:hypothetical protein
VSGDIEKGRATLDRPNESEMCVITFGNSKNGDEIDVGANEACRHYCGARAWFAGTYVRPAVGCRTGEVRRSRHEFKRLYDAKRYPEARAIMDRLLVTCARTLEINDERRMRNDLAVTLHKVGEFGTCRDVLAPLAEDAGLSDAELEKRYVGVVDRETYMPIVRAARTNLALCKG